MVSSFNTASINSCLRDIDTDLEEIAKGNQTAMRRVRKCLMELSKECKTQRSNLMEMSKKKKFDNTRATVSGEGRLLVDNEPEPVKYSEVKKSKKGTPVYEVKIEKSLNQ